MSNEKNPIKKSPLAILMENHQKTITITDDMVGDTVSYIPLSGAIIACNHFTTGREYTDSDMIGFAEWILKGKWEFSSRAGYWVRSIDNTGARIEYQSSDNLLQLYKESLTRK